MTVKEIVEAWLKTNGYGGLWSDECGCELSDLAPCGQMDESCCEAGYKVNCDENCNHDEPCDWHIQATKPTQHQIHRKG